MFQSFDSVTDPSQGKVRVAELRTRLAEMEIDGFLVPRADEHQGEYVAARSERLQWLTGFTGSAGAAIVMRDRAVVFVDGRYTLQARTQVDADTFAIESLVETPPSRWLGENAGKGQRIGFDPWLHTISETVALAKALEARGAALVPLDENPVDAVWSDQPDAPAGAVVIHSHERAGELAREKLARLSASIAAQGATHGLLTDPSSVAWAFNIRGSDVPHTPLVLCFAILRVGQLPLLFIDPKRLDIETRAYLTQLADLLAPDELPQTLAAMAGNGARVSLDPALAAEKFRLIIEGTGGSVVHAPDPARLPRATKNAAELAGARAAHLRDGAAICSFLCWLDRQPAGSIDEIAATVALEESRRTIGEAMQMPLRDISFDTIAGSGPNGAIVHYRVTHQTNRTLGDGELFLVDSGAQYEDGTTDITRTVAIGTPTAEMVERTTLVLKGLIAVSTTRFPPGTRGQDIDPLARAALWKAGLDYAHGTGHGVGSYLAVHEGPQRIARTGAEKLLAGMIISNEPGYYKEGAYGIRLENLIVVEPAAPLLGGDIATHGFQTLTLAPFDRRLIDPARLTNDELEWLDAYHARVLAEVGPLVDSEVLAWLEAATAPLADQPST